MYLCSCNPLIDQCWKPLHDFMCKGIYGCIYIGGKLPDVVLMIGIVTVLNAGLKL